MESKRKKRRKLKKKLKMLFIMVPSVVAVVLFLIFFFKLQKVSVSSDLGQFSSAEVKSYMQNEGINNTLFFWFKSKIGKEEKLDLFEKYSVKMNSPFEVTITAYEKRLKGYIAEEKICYYLDESGTIFKKTSEKIKGVPKITGLKYEKLSLYKKIQTKDTKALNALLKVINSAKEYDFDIKRIDVSEEQEVTLYIKKLQVQLGKATNIERKLLKFNEFYDKAIGYEGVLNMKRLSPDGNYTLEQPTKEEKNKKKQ